MEEEQRKAWEEFRAAMMEADDLFTQHGAAGTKTYINDYLIPRMEGRGLCVVASSRLSRLERVRGAAKNAVSARDDYLNNIAKYAGRGGFVREADEALREALRAVE